VGAALERLWGGLGALLTRHHTVARAAAILLAVTLYNVYLVAAIWRGVSTSAALDYCDDVGFLIILTVFVYLLLFYFLVVKRLLGGALQRGVVAPLAVWQGKVVARPHSSLAATLVVLVAATTFLLVDAAGEPRRLVSAVGVLVLILLGFVFSRHPGRVVWRHVVWGLALQFVFGLLILRWPVGQATFRCLGAKVSTFLAYTDVGSTFVFGYLVDQRPIRSWAVNGTALEVADQLNGNFHFVFMFKVLSIIYFFNFCISMLFHLGAMQWLVVKLGWLLQVLHYATLNYATLQYATLHYTTIHYMTLLYTALHYR